MSSYLVLSSLLLWVVVILNLLLTLALIRRVNSIGQQGNLPNLDETISQLDTLQPGSDAPDFTVVTLDNREVTRPAYANKEHIMVFIAPNCRPCTARMPAIQQLYYEAQQVGVELIIISLDDVSATQKYVEELSLRVPVFSAEKGENPVVTPKSWTQNRLGLF